MGYVALYFFEGCGVAYIYFAQSFYEVFIPVLGRALKAGVRCFGRFFAA